MCLHRGTKATNTKTPHCATPTVLRDDDRYTKQPGPSDGIIGFDHARVVRSEAPYRDGEAATKTTDRLEAAVFLFLTESPNKSGRLKP